MEDSDVVEPLEILFLDVTIGKDSHKGVRTAPRLESITHVEIAGNVEPGLSGLTKASADHAHKEGHPRKKTTSGQKEQETLIDTKNEYVLLSQ
mmetsp:Transcript_36566/g.53683  ORF Transcript_36566/g.53683 Transcript_36566/m.53683 type:complete len:93 (-) Transcript_36566:22-300(-)